VEQSYEPTSGGTDGKTDLFLDKDGRWFHEGIEITHQRTCSLFSRSLTKGSDGRYYVRVGKEYAPVDLEDKPFVIKSVTIVTDSEESCSMYRILLNDETEETLDPNTLTIGPDHVMYCTVKGSTVEARFLRSAYYQISAHVEYIETEDRYVLPWKGHNYPIHSCKPRTTSGI
jgi:uncharacterized protein